MLLVERFRTISALVFLCSVLVTLVREDVFVDGMRARRRNWSCSGLIAHWKGRKSGREGDLEPRRRIPFPRAAPDCLVSGNGTTRSQTGHRSAQNRRRKSGAVHEAGDVFPRPPEAVPARRNNESEEARLVCEKKGG